MATTADLLDLVAIGQRTDRFRFDLLNKSLGKIGELHPDQARVPSMEVNVTRTSKRTLTGIELVGSERTDVNVYADRVRPMMLLENGAEFSLGVLAFADPASRLSTGGDRLRSSLVDLAMGLDQGIERNISVPPGIAVTTAIVGLLDEYGLGPYVVEPSGMPMRTWGVWISGSATLWQVLSDLAQLAGYFTPYYDRHGVLTFRPIPSLGSTLPAVAYEYGRNILSDPAPDVGEGSIDAPNRYVVIDTAATDTPVVGYYDIPSTAPHSYAQRGVRIVHTTRVQGLGNNGAAYWTARAIAVQTIGETPQWATFASPIDPRHDVHDVVTFLGEPYYEHRWAFPLRAGATMSHELRRAYADD